MPLIISPSFVLQPPPAGTSDRSRPIIGWENQIVVSGVTADFEQPNFPASNVANPATNLLWISSSTDEQHLTFDLNEELASDYIGIARHNLGSAGVVITVEVLNFDDASWSEMIEGFVVPDDAPIMIRYNPVVAAAIRLKLTPFATAPQIAVVHVGRLLNMPIGVSIGHTPLIDGRVTRTTAGLSEAGDYLGSIVLSQKLESSASFQNLDEDWYRRYMRPFVKLGRGTPFFFSGFPESHPREAGYAWLTSDPKPDFGAALMVDVTLDMGGIVT